MNEQQATEIFRVVSNLSEAFQSIVKDDERAALNAKHAAHSDSLHYPAASREEATLQFTIDALSTFADDIGCVLEQRKESLYREALEIYYKAKELSRNPEHAHLIEHVEAMRCAHEKEYGHPPPSRNA